jgi:hypothetical protein
MFGHLEGNPERMQNFGAVLSRNKRRDRHFCRSRRNGPLIMECGASRRFWIKVA